MIATNIYEIYGEQNRKKVDYLLKFFRKETLIDAVDEVLIDEINKINLEEYINVTKELPDNLKMILEQQIIATIDALKSDTTEFRGIFRDTKLISMIDKYTDSNSSIDKVIKNNSVYTMFIESNVITKEQLKNIIDNKINVEKIDLYNIECNIYEELKKHLPPNKEEFIESLDSTTENYANLKKVFEIFYNTNEVYKHKNIVEYLEKSNIENIKYDTLDDIAAEPRLLSELIYNTDIERNFYKCLDKQKPCDFESIEAVVNMLKAKEHSNGRIPAREYSCIRIFEIYKNYSTYIHSLNYISTDIIDLLTKETFDKVLGDNVDTIDIRKLCIEVIFKDIDLSEDQKRKIKSYLTDQYGTNLRINRISKEDIDVLRKNVSTLSNEQSDILKFYYIKNIENDPKLKQEVDALHDDFKKPFVYVNRYASKPELNNLLRALKSKRQNNIEENMSETDITKETLISSLSPEKRLELQDITREMTFREFCFDLNLPQHMTFGVELEFEKMSHATLKALSRENVLTDQIITNLGVDTDKKSILHGWDIKRDGSVETGAEIASPILKDNPKDWESLKTVCDIVTFLGGQNDESCGGHIHIGSNILGTDSKAWENFLKIWGNAEEYIYKMSNKEGNQIRKKVGQYASPTKNVIKEILERGSIHIETDEDIRNLASEYSSFTTSELTDVERYKGVNLYTISSNKQNTIEFRIPNGEINPVEIQKNIKLYAKILEVSKKMSLNPKYKKELFDSLESQQSTDEDKLYSFIDLVFDDKKDKAIYLSRYFNYPKELKIGEISYKEAMEKKPVKIERGGR